MNQHGPKRSVINRRSALLICILGMLCLSAAARSQHGEDKKRERAKIRQRISSIIRETLNRGEITTAEGIKVIVRSKPETKDIEEVVSYGDEAVVVLTDFLKSENTREYELTMRLLGALGGERIVQPLRDVIMFDSSPRKREYALAAITQAPWNKAEPIIRMSSETDPDAQVRRVAERLLKGYSPTPKSPPQP